MTHTATPWRLDQYGNAKDQGGRDNILVTGFSLNTGHSSKQAEANTSFIVRACNAHDELVAALKEITSLSPDDSTTDWNCALKMCAAALTKAGAT